MKTLVLALIFVATAVARNVSSIDIISERNDRPIIGVVTLPFMGLAVAGGAARRRLLSPNGQSTTVQSKTEHSHHHRQREEPEVKSMVRLFHDALVDQHVFH